MPVRGLRSRKPLGVGVSAFSAPGAWQQVAQRVRASPRKTFKRSRSARWPVVGLSPANQVMLENYSPTIFVFVPAEYFHPIRQLAGNSRGHVVARGRGTVLSPLALSRHAFLAPGTRENLPCPVDRTAPMALWRLHFRVVVLAGLHAALGASRYAGDRSFARRRNPPALGRKFLGTVCRGWGSRCGWNRHGRNRIVDR